MAEMVTDPNDPRLGRGIDNKATEQHEAYLVLSDEEREKGFIRPVRRSYTHKLCHTETSMPVAIAETYARDPKFYGATYCVFCGRHLPVSEFLWKGTDEEVGS